MAKKASFDSELVKDSRREHRKQAPAAGQPPHPAPDPQPSLPPPTSAGPSPEPPPQGAPEPAPGDEFKKRFDEYFKGAGQFVSGQLAVEMVDDLKSNLLYIYARKQGVEIEKDALKLDAKAKEFAAFAVDFAIRNKALAWLEKYPIVAAAGVIAISAGSGFLVIQAMKAMKDKEKKAADENEQLRAEVERLRKEKQADRHANATDADIESETPDPENKAVSEMIASL